jgi:ADP-heptose:LPS heptosyltransferase
MKIIDEILGFLPALWPLDILGTTSYLCHVSSYLIIQTAFFGDVILATALIEQLAAEQPDAKIDVLVQKSREVLLLGNPHIDSIYTLDKKQKLKSTWSLVRLFERKNMMW